MQLKDIKVEWQKDTKIDKADLGHESIRTPSLHSKYLDLLVSKKLQRRKTYVEYLQMCQTKTRYYKGEMTKEELQAHGWPQYLKKSPLKAELETLLESDEDVNKVKDKVEYLDVTIEYLESVMKSLSSRTWDIKSAVEWAKFTNGAF